MLDNIRLLLCSALISCSLFISPAFTQESPCPEIDDMQCAYLVSAMQTWNSLYGANVALKGWEPESDIEAAVQTLLEGKELWIPVQQENTVIGAVRIGDGHEQNFAEWESSDGQTWSAWVERYSQSAKYAFNLHWGSENESFVTKALILSEWPYIIDSMLSNVFLVEESNSCVREHVYWIWGSVRGDVFIDVSTIDKQTGILCLPMAEAYMELGTPKIQLGPVTYDGDTCVFDYAYAFATPFGKLTLKRNPLEFEISGIGSGRKGQGSCAATAGP